METEIKTSSEAIQEKTSAEDSQALDAAPLPRHVAIIMDGNGRWAQRKGMPRIEGHRNGVKTVRKIVRTAAKAGVEYLTLYCLSSENWKRPPAELSFLMFLLKKYLVDERKEILRQKLQFRTIGRTEELSAGILDEINKTKKLSADNTGMTLCLALNYGARGEIIDAVRKLAEQVERGELQPGQIDEQILSNSLDTTGMPDPDLVIRTAGEMRISNFLLWQISYSELWVTDKHWPEFTEADFHMAMQDYVKRDRRFGGLNS
ncbi:isoprenyl transferase [Rubinisphaera italica]|uniref:Isoprenyl transferase n=1 Tax=Rubinisphaera italica TaxID=2527969 RepID=A0A5C5XAN9_9PLAN|nr:isoprenyl transferase [Rubinisphaera italica]TWT59874.1 Decaprenyl diphosphate synthase-like protein [Rubinisphaera italica]